MRLSSRSILSATLLSLLTWSVVPAAVAQSAAALQGDKAPAVEQRTERILVEDAGSRIDELRIGGETKRIVVQPKGGMPAYEVQPANASTAGSATTGNRVWKVLGF